MNLLEEQGRIFASILSVALPHFLFGEYFVEPKPRSWALSDEEWDLHRRTFAPIKRAWPCLAKRAFWCNRHQPCKQIPRRLLKFVLLRYSLFREQKHSEMKIMGMLENCSLFVERNTLRQVGREDGSANKAIFVSF